MPVVEVPADLIGSSGLYNSTDPLLRRLRLEDQQGSPITDVAKTFKDVEVLIIYAGSAEGANNVVELHKNLNHLIKHQKSAAVIYCSTDVDAKLALAVTASQPWYRMTFFDDSDFAPLAQGAAEVTDVSRGEDFVHAGEIEVEAEVVPFGTTEDPQDYVRPLSRAAVGMTIRAYATPSIAIYNIPKHRFLAYNVRDRAFLPERVPKNYYEWKQGAPESFKIWDLVHHMRYQIIALVLFALYQLLIFVGGEEYNFIPGLMDQLSWRMRQLGAPIEAPTQLSDLASKAADLAAEVTGHVELA
ncbi:uncharacterized protein EHS24_009077 [Apiotrichum porosum]|uniref:Uncharacterized protein n=1 Tax=Apiotrichum porosum TaxID=105984 RepID=A0A427XP36_9TREE|nr:uncharacterized protein EHS24_009077 [Apiotrichum porosum]RSH80497.1 hypothetical protein EHS24_009077 [Apiotrichum porosum]